MLDQFIIQQWLLRFRAYIYICMYSKLLHCTVYQAIKAAISLQPLRRNDMGSSPAQDNYSCDPPNNWSEFVTLCLYIVVVKVFTLNIGEILNTSRWYNEKERLYEIRFRFKMMIGIWIDLVC